MHIRYCRLNSDGGGDGDGLLATRSETACIVITKNVSCIIAINPTTATTAVCACESYQRLHTVRHLSYVGKLIIALLALNTAIIFARIHRITLYSAKKMLAETKQKTQRND